MSEQLLINLAILSQKPTGLTTYAANLVPHLRSLHPTLLIADQFPNFAAADFACHPIPAQMTSDQGSKGHLKRLLWTQFQLPKIVRSRPANLLFSPVPEAPLFTRTRFVVMVHDLIPLRFPKATSPLTHYARYYVPQVLRQAQHIVCNSLATAEDITHFYQIPSRKITPIPLAYDANHFRWLNLPTQNYFLYLGRLDPYKNIQRVIAALAALPNPQDYELWIAGPKDDRFTPKLQAQIAQLGLTTQVKFLDYVAYADLPRIINGAIALVFPSLCEGFGLPALEAMACGTPVITSNCSSLPEVVGDAAILVDPYQVREIAEAMQTIATNSQLRSTLHTASLARASQFSWAKTGAATAKALHPFI